MAVRTITRRMNEMENEFERKLKSIHSKESYKNLIVTIENTNNREERNSLIAELIRKLDDNGIPNNNDLFVDPNKINEDIKEMRRFIENCELLKTPEESRACLLDIIQKTILEAPIPSDYLSRIVNRVCGDEWEGDSLRLKILKRYIKYGRDAIFDPASRKEGIKEDEIPNLGAGYGGKVHIYKCAKEHAGADTKIEKEDYDKIADYIDESVFDILSDNEKSSDSFKPGSTYGIIKVVNDLVNGLYRSSHSTKKDLYIFAMVFDMTFFYENDDYAQIRADDYLDIESNLFNDYYQYSIKNMLIHKSIKDKLDTEYAMLPSDSQINYNNYAELIYIYYITKPQMSAEEKIRESARLIDRVKRTDFDTSNNKLQSTQNNHDMFIEDILQNNKNEDELLDFIFSDLLVPDHKDYRKKSVLQYRDYSDTAFKEYNSIIELIVSAKKNEITDLYKNKDGMTLCEHHLKELSDDEDMVYVLDRMQEELSPELRREKHRSGKKNKDKEIKIKQRKNSEKEEDKKGNNDSVKPAEESVDEYVHTKEKLTRTEMIAAFYELFFLTRVIDNVDKEDIFDFEDIYNDFKNGIDGYLERAGYSKISVKNLFDVLAIVSEYDLLSFD